MVIIIIILFIIGLILLILAFGLALGIMQRDVQFKPLPPKVWKRLIVLTWHGMLQLIVNVSFLLFIYGTVVIVYKLAFDVDLWPFG